MVTQSLKTPTPHLHTMFQFYYMQVLASVHTRSPMSIRGPTTHHYFQKAEGTTYINIAMCNF